MEEVELSMLLDAAPSQGYAVSPDGSWRAVHHDMELQGDEVFYKTVPQWAIDLQEQVAINAQLVAIEDKWRNDEINLIANQLMAIEEAESAIEEGLDPPDDLLSGTRSQWLAYRTKVRAWKTGGDISFPDKAFRPTRPK